MTTATASSIHGDINHQSTVTLHHHLGSLSTHVKNDGNLFTFSAASTENSTEDLILYASNQANETSSMDFLLDDDVDGDIVDGENGGSSRESIANLLDEGLGTSLDGTDEISPSTTHSTLGRNDSGVFSSDESPRSILGGSLNLAALPATSNYTSTSAMMTALTTTTSSPTATSSANSSPSTLHLPNCSTPTLNSMTNPTVLPSLLNSSIATGETPKPKKAHRPKTSSPNRQGPQCCLTCGKVFSNASALTKHKLTHSDERKHICGTCGKAFKRQDHLNGHMLTHRNKKPYECTAKGCGKSYCDARSLRRHVESRHGHEMSMTIAPNGNISNTTDSATAVESHTRHTIESQQLKQPRTTKIRSQSSSSSNDIISALDCNPTNLLMDDDMVNCTVLGLSDADLLNSQFESPLEGVVVNCLDDSAAASLDPLALAMVTDGELDNHDNNKMIAIKMENNNNNHDCTNTMISVGNNNNQQQQQNHHYIHPHSPLVGNGFDFQKNCVTTTMRSQTQSQLHQLLTQRVSSGAASSSLANNRNNDATTVTNSNLVLNTSPGVLNNKHLPNGGSPAEAMTPVVVETLSQFNKSIPTTATNAKELNKSGTVKAQRNYTAKKAKGQNGTAKNSISNSGSASPTFLKDQLELIQQIIQKAQEDTHNSTESTSGGSALANGSTRKCSTKGVTKKSKSSSASSTKSDSSQFSDDLSGGGKEDKPVECSRCSRRFKNTPALNGHMRLHGGFYNKKDIEGAPAPRKKEHHAHHHHHKDSNSNSGNAPLQTASISVRTLIGEKINQKRNTSTSSLTHGIDKPVAILPAHVNQVSTSSSPEVSQNGFALATDSRGNGIHQQQPERNPLPVSSNLNSTSSCGSEQEEHDDQQQNLQFICEQDYFLMEEEVFNKVSSICPDSFLVGIDETILRSTTNATAVTSAQGTSQNSSNSGEELGSEWNWSADPNNGGVASIEVTNSSGINPRLNILFSSTSGSSSNSPSSSTTTVISDHFNKVGNGNGPPFAPLPPLDPVFYPSPTPLSPSLHSQDSPSFIYPTPPASLESHNLQSPLFPFPSSSTVTTNTASIPSNTQVSSSKNNTTLLYPFETQLNNNSILIPKTQIQQQNVDKMLAENCMASDPQDILLIYTSSASGMGQSSIISSSAPVTGMRNYGMGTSACEIPSATETGFSTSVRKPTPALKTGIKVRSCSGSSLSDTLTFLTPSSSPSLASNVSCSSSASCWGSPDDSAKEFKVNEVNRMDRSATGVDGEDMFVNPNSVPTSPSLKSSKRKHVRNTFASNLRPHHACIGTVNSGSHFTPYPILSPVRSAPGLFWQFSPVLSHVDVAKREVPRINVGQDFQVEELPTVTSAAAANDSDNVMSVALNAHERKLWTPEVMENCTDEQVNTFLQFSSCLAIPEGKRDKEYALHLLSHCKGDIENALLLLMQRDPELPEYMRNYNYLEGKEWSQEEFDIFEKSLLDHGKDFPKVADKIRTKTSADCVSFYQQWKKKYSLDYERIKNIWKKRETAFTLNLLKNVPPPVNDNPLFPSSTSNVKSEFLLDSCDIITSETIPDSVSPTDDVSLQNNVQAHTHDEFPCRICGKVFNKVKSRSAHMKSHRPPDQPSQNSDNPSPTKKAKLNKLSASKLKGTSPSAGVRPPLVPALSSANAVSCGDVVSHADVQSNNVHT